jgi:hypothetical protein
MVEPTAQPTLEQPDPQAPITAQKALEQEQDALGLQPGEAAALCLSGGGIRSAAFCLGVVQGLARMGVLKQFNYLSTVSGGGYIGGYLAARLRALEGNTDALQQELTQGGNAPWLTRLRQSGNFLTPQLGLFSLDTWTGLTLYTRNLLLTWASLLPWALLLVLGFIFYRTLLAVAGAVHWLAVCAVAIGLLGLIISTWRLCNDLPSHQQTNQAQRPPPWSFGQGAAGRTVRIALAWPLLAPFALGVWIDADAPTKPNTPFGDNDAVWLGGLFFLGLCLPYLAAWMIAEIRRRQDDPPPRALFRANVGPWVLAAVAAAVLTGLGPWLLRCLVDAPGRVSVLAVVGPIWFALAMVVHAGAYMGLRRNAPADMAELDREWTATMSARIIRVAVAATVAGFPILALAGYVIPANDGSWGSDVWGTILSPLVTGPAVAWLGHQAFTRMSALNEMDAKWRDKAFDLAMMVLAAVFAATVLALLSSLLQSYVLGPLQQAAVALLPQRPAGEGSWALLFAAWNWLADLHAWPMRLGQAWHWLTNDGAWTSRLAQLWQWLLGSGTCLSCAAPKGPLITEADPSLWHIINDYWGRNLAQPTPWVKPVGPRPVPAIVMFGVQAGLAILLALAALALRIDNNRFTLHALYRNRLVRGFLGPAREARDPEPVTGFDPQDDLRLSQLTRCADGAPATLFPVINIAVNAAQSSTAQWTERKALSFTATPLHCGYFHPLADPLRPPGSDRTYVPTTEFNHSANGTAGRGLGLGTAITISGAAASPNSGYHSRPATALLMTLFNVRLGLWAPNTRTPRARPGLTAAEQRRALFDDLRGNSSIDGPAIYLSDGGHFDNLGLYEMLRRRCRFIVVVDAAHDPEYGFADLGQSLRKAAIDLGVTVAITATRIGPRKDGTDNASLLGFALGEITYPETPDRPTGKLLYIKPTWLAHLPMDVRAYGAAEKDFPQQPTSDQWFSESQFESYRSLGTHQLECLARKNGRTIALDRLFRRAAARLATAR